MMKNLIYAAAFTLVFASSVPATWATGRPSDARFSHLVDTAAYPNNASSLNAIHQFEVHVQGIAVSELSIDLPEGVSIHRGIEVTNQSGQEVAAEVSVNDRKATVVFFQPVPPGTVLSVSMRGVDTGGIDNTWQYRVNAKKVGLTTEISLGSARIQTQRD